MAVTPEQGLDMEALEGMVDRHGLTQVLCMLCEICSEKAEHLRANWQDKANAKHWDKDGIIIERAAARVNN